VRERARAMLVACPAAGYAACCGAIERMDLRADLPRIAVATLVIGGLGDLATPPEHQRLIAGAIPGARLELLRGAAHLATAERPEAVTRLILDHLEASP
jgi:3-oxoadipate enol-lactonase